MHASIALCLMIVGGPVAPDPDITIVPLKDDLTAVVSVQDLEWKERVKRHPLPHAPTLGDSQPSNGREDRSNYWQRRSGIATDPNVMRKAQTTMPFSPTEGGEAPVEGRRVTGSMPMVPGAGGVGGGAPGNSFERNDRYSGNNNSNSLPGQRPVSGGYGNSTLTSAPRVPYTPSVSTAINGAVPNPTNGLAPNPMLSPSGGGGGGGGGGKPFDDYQRPNGYSPWMSLYTTPTNNGTISTYTSTVQPQIQQQQFNAQVTEQIRGVQSNYRGNYNGTPGMEMPSGGGLVNPNSVINVGGTYIPGH